MHKVIPYTTVLVLGLHAYVARFLGARVLCVSTFARAASYVACSVCLHFPQHRSMLTHTRLSTF